MRILIAARLLAVLALFTESARAQFTYPPDRHLSARPLSAHILVPQARPWTASHPGGTVQISEINLGVEIVEQVAITTMDISLTNATGARLETEMIVPVPDKAVLRGFTFQGAGSEPKAEILVRDEARRIYDSIVAQTRDPALLEFIGYNLIRSSVFPVEPNRGQKVRLIYEHVLTSDGDRVDYTLPRTESIDYRVPWKISVRIASKRPISTIYSPSHKLETARLSENRVTARVSHDATAEPGPFRLSYLLQRDGISASLLAYPDPKVGGGYFLLLAGVPPRSADTPVRMKREVILVLDRSGSMAGEKLEQVRAAAWQVLEGLEDGEAFNIIVYHESVESFAPAPVIKSGETMKAARAYIGGLRVRGGTNIHDALVEALRMRPTRDCIPIVLFLTDGLPTVGQTSEKAIREVAAKANPHERRIFTFGVGVDVNTPLLDRIAIDTRAASTYVLPKEDVEVKVGQVFKRLAGPVLASPKLQPVDEAGQPEFGRTRDLMPAKLPDLFEGDQLVLLGHYAGDKPLTFVLNGNYLGQTRSFQFRFDLEKATTKNAFVPRLWASRRIATLTDAIRDLGADGTAGATPAAASDPRLRELVDAIVQLSKEFGILTEYTAFLAREGTDLSQPAFVAAEAFRNFNDRAVNIRSGYASINQSFNNIEQRGQQCLNVRNSYLDSNLNRVEVSAVQQVNDRAFYKRGNRWVDSALVDAPAAAPRRVVEFGSEEFRRLASRLAEQGRQGCVALKGEILMQVDGETVLVR
jgi:Ca-activated chloride channel family protein